MTQGYEKTTLDIINLPKNIPEYIPYIIDDNSLAFNLYIRNKIMWGIIHNLDAHYTQHQIAKKSGGYRTVYNPSEVLKYLQTNLCTYVLNPLQERLGKHVTAYRPGLNVLAAVKQHIHTCPICSKAKNGKPPKKHSCPKRGLLLQLDLKDFFGTTSRAMVRNYFKSLGYSHYVASLIATLTTYKLKTEGTKTYTGIPQGTPSGGAICNLVGNALLDLPIMAYLHSVGKKYGTTFVYTRYSDDITISTNKEFNGAIGDQIIKEVLTGILQHLAQTPYRLNHKKTRVTSPHKRRTILGIVCNTKHNYAKNNYYTLRAIIHNCTKTNFTTQAAVSGYTDTAKFVRWLKGTVNWATQISSTRGATLKKKLTEALELHREEIINVFAKETNSNNTG